MIKFITQFIRPAHFTIFKKSRFNGHALLLLRLDNFKRAIYSFNPCKIRYKNFQPTHKIWKKKIENVSMGK